MSEVTRPDLRIALQFTEDDLIPNRAGLMSEGQRARLKAQRKRAALIGAGMVAVIGLAAVMLLFIGQQNNSEIARWIGIGVTICNALLVGTLARNWLRVSTDIDSGKVDALKGTVHHTIRVAGRTSTYLLKLQDEEVMVAKEVFLAIKEGEPYRLFVAPGSRAVLAAEALG